MIVFSQPTAWFRQKHYCNNFLSKKIAEKEILMPLWQQMCVCVDE